MHASFAKTVILDAYASAGRNALGLLRAMWLPVLLGGLSLYFMLDLYFTLLQRFLASPSSRESSLALAAAAGGMVLWFLFHATAAMTVMRSGMNHPHRAWFRLRIRRAELRMFAGILRFLTIIAAWGTFVVGAWYIAHLVGVWYGADGAVDMLLASIAATTFLVGTVVFWTRLVFLMPALVAAERVRVLRRSWVLSRGYLLPMLAVWLSVTMPPLLLMEALGDLLLNTGMFGAPMQWSPSQDLNATTLAGIRAMLPGWIATFTVCTSISLALTVMGSVSAYRQLTGTKA